MDYNTPKLKTNYKNINIINLLNQQHEIIKKEKISTPITIEILDDLSSRFIINLPNEEKGDIIRVLFQIEIAHWFYVDFYLVEQPDLMKYNLKPFAKLMFKHVPFLRQYLDKFDEVFDKWRDYKHNVPTYGAIILDDLMENVLMVQGFWTNSTWGFPKGKVNAEEDPVVCACREVKEEIGFDLTELIEKNEYIDMHIRETYVRLYIIAGVSKDEQFAPLTRNEIRKIQWFPIKNLPTSRQDKELNPNAFFMVIPIIKSLKRWIYERRGQKNNTFNNNNYHQSPRNYYICSPVSYNNKYSKDNHYMNKNMTHQLNGNRNRLFSNSDKVTILKNNKNSNKNSKNNYSNSNGRRFWSETLANFSIDLDKLWQECIDEYSET